MILYTSLKCIFGVEELQEDEAAAAVAMTVDLSAMNTLIATTPMSCDETSGKMVYFRGTGILHSTRSILWECKKANSVFVGTATVSSFPFLHYHM